MDPWRYSTQGISVPLRVTPRGGRDDIDGLETLADGRTVRARQFVASTIDVHQTFETMIGRAQLPEDFCRKLLRARWILHHP